MIDGEGGGGKDLIALAHSEDLDYGAVTLDGEAESTCGI
jgi:hypothetical protein